MSNLELIQIIEDFLNSIDEYEDSEGNYPCYWVDKEKENAANKAVEQLKAQLQTL